MTSRIRFRKNITTLLSIIFVRRNNHVFPLPRCEEIGCFPCRPDSTATIQTDSRPPDIMAAPEARDCSTRRSQYPPTTAFCVEEFMTFHLMVWTAFFNLTMSFIVYSHWNRGTTNEVRNFCWVEPGLARVRHARWRDTWATRTHDFDARFEQVTILRRLFPTKYLTRSVLQQRVDIPLYCSSSDDLFDSFPRAFVER